MKKLKEILEAKENIIQISTVAKNSGDYYYTITALTSQNRIFIKERLGEWREI